VEIRIGVNAAAGFGFNQHCASSQSRVFYFPEAPHVRTA
jgi:hypothetical protein